MCIRDSGALLPVLKDYRRPNDKIAEWLRQGVLLPLKRGPVSYTHLAELEIETEQGSAATGGSAE